MNETASPLSVSSSEELVAWDRRMCDKILRKLKLSLGGTEETRAKTAQGVPGVLGSMQLTGSPLRSKNVKFNHGGGSSGLHSRGVTGTNKRGAIRPASAMASSAGGSFIYHKHAHT